MFNIFWYYLSIFYLFDDVIVERAELVKNQRPVPFRARIFCPVPFRVGTFIYMHAGYIFRGEFFGQSCFELLLTRHSPPRSPGETKFHQHIITLLLQYSTATFAPLFHSKIRYLICGIHLCHLLKKNRMIIETVWRNGAKILSTIEMQSKRTKCLKQLTKTQTCRCFSICSFETLFHIS
jgi:hypothetical protein